ncbi:MAG: hypothetical protein HZA79_15070 [Sphingobacteriales bacterium]|nr:hypothetical protein [Sphingobacteriales bacterium]
MILALLGITGFYALADMISMLIHNKRAGKPFYYRSFEFIAVIGAPLFFLLAFDYGKVNDCCADSAFFSPAHRPAIYTLIFLCMGAYYYSSLREKTAPPLAELLVNCLLGTGLVLAVLIGIHAQDPVMWVPGIPAVLFFYISQLVRNQRLLLDEITGQQDDSLNPVNRICLAILRSNLYIRFPLLLVISVPMLLVISLFLYLFGQKPDSAIRAFTETYKLGLSQWDYKCENVQCGGHYLCSVAANGHPGIVKPVRLGKRNHHFIICNRQLLVSNAFEELIREKFPAVHRRIRLQYDKIGDRVHRNYEWYSKKWVSDFVYLAMKPAEWFFLFVLYMADHKPEQRIARQYAPWS